MDPNIPTQTPPTQPVLPSNKILKLSKPIFISLLVALAIAIPATGYFLSKSQPTKQISTVQNSPTPTPDPTANWKTYVSTKGNLSLKYPETWPLINVSLPNDPAVPVEDINFSPSYNPSTADTNLAYVLVMKEGWVKNVKTIDEYIDFLKTQSTNIDINKTKLGGEEAVSYRLSGGIKPLSIIEYVTTKNRLWYILSLTDSVETNKNREVNIKIFNEILSTFKFTNL